MPEPKVVVAVGICACSAGIFKQCYNIMGGVDTVIPVSYTHLVNIEMKYPDQEIS